MAIARFKPWPCASCGYVMDAASDSTGNALPAEGDLSVCLQCAAPYLLESHKWRPLTDDELIEMSLEHKRVLSRVQNLVRKYHRENPRK
jgi:hypothetical protein